MWWTPTQLLLKRCQKDWNFLIDILLPDPGKYLIWTPGQFQNSISCYPKPGSLHHFACPVLCSSGKPLCPSRFVKLKCEFHVPENYSDSVALWNLLSATCINDPHAYGKFKNLKQAGCVCGGGWLLFQHPEGWGRRIKSLRTAWLHRPPVSKTKQTWNHYVCIRLLPHLY